MSNTEVKFNNHRYLSSLVHFFTCNHSEKLIFIYKEIKFRGG